MSASEQRDAAPTDRHPPRILEYVTIPGCADCRAFERLLERILPDYPEVEAREVAGETPRGLSISVERGVLRFPVIVLDDDVIAVESIAESELRSALDSRRDRR